MYKVDYHIHSNFSDGQPSYKEIIDKAKKFKMDCIAITDHFDLYDPNPEVNKLKEEDLLLFFRRVKEYADLRNQRVLCGIETCTDFNGNLRLSDKVFNQCEVIITSPHYVEYEEEIIPGCYFDKNFWERYKEKVLNMAAKEGDILGHPEGYLPYGKMLIPNSTTYEERQELSRKISERYFDDEYLNKLIQNLKKSGKAYELHSITSTPRECVIEKLVKNRVSISFGSDAHVLEAACNTEWAAKMLKRFEGEELQFLK